MSQAAIPSPSRRQQRKMNRRRRRPARPTFLGVVGEFLITLGLVVLLFVVWELYWTNIGANREAREHRDNMMQNFSKNYTGLDDGIDPAVPATLIPGEAWGLLYIPRFGPDYMVPVLDGTGPEIDSAVVGRYEGSPRPGEEGNMAFAGHRQTYGAVLWQMDSLQNGDRMYLQTANGWWVYETRKVHIVAPSATEVLNPNPMDIHGQADGHWLTLTTCHPPYTVLERMVTHAEQVDFIPREDGVPEELSGVVEDFQAVDTPEYNDAVIHSPEV